MFGLDSIKRHEKFQAKVDVNQTQPPPILTRLLKRSPLNSNFSSNITKNVIYDFDNPKNTTALDEEEIKEEKKRRSYDDAYSDKKASIKMGSASSGDSFPMSKLFLHRHRTVRSHVYSNERTSSMNMDRWIQMHSKTAGGISPSKKRALEMPNNGDLNIIFEAHYYGSDDGILKIMLDFLMNVEVRNYFKKNALDSTDALLFSLTGETDEPSRPISNLGNSGISVNNFQIYYALQDERSWY